MSDRPKAILVGGIYGSGKSTLAKSLAIYSHVSVIDYDEIIGDIAGNGQFKDEALLNARRVEAWKNGFIGGIKASVLKGNPITVALATFTTRERRDRYWDSLSEVAEVQGYYLMPPMRESLQRIKDNRPRGAKLVNADTVYGFYRTHNQTFVKDSHQDLIVPEDIPAEYKALLKKSGYYSQNNSAGRWRVLTQTLQPEMIVGQIHVAA